MLARLYFAFASQRRFVADASHQLRMLLAIIKANLDLALTDAAATDESRATAAAVIKRAIDRMARLTDDLLALARLDVPALGPRAGAARGAARGRAGGVRGGGRGAAVRTRETAVVPGRIVQGDRDVLKRAVTNLLDNAWPVLRPRGRASVSRTASSTAGRGSPSPTTAPGSRPRPGLDLRPLLARRRRPLAAGRRQRARARDRAADRRGAPRLGRRLLGGRSGGDLRRLAAVDRRRARGAWRRSHAARGARLSPTSRSCRRRG